jgi:hypothetical protein
VLALLLTLLLSQASASTPSWAVNDTERLEGTRYRAVCSGDGPSIGLARRQAIDDCKVSAAEHLPGEITVKSLSVLSEQDGAYHQEVTRRSRVTGLSCNPLREHVEETDARVKVWILCLFDLSRAHARIQWPVLAKRRGGRAGVLTLAVLPDCTSVIVRGSGPARVVRCDRNPVSVLVEPGDNELLVRGEGSLPKWVAVPPELGIKGREYARVVLDPAG